MKIQLLLLFTAMMLYACGGGNKKVDGAGSDTGGAPEEEKDFFVFDLETGIFQSPEAQILNELIDTITYIPLETRPEALFPERYALAKIGDDLFIRGGLAHQRSPVYQFNSRGRFVKQLTYHGRGPNEILLTMAWYANAKLKQINVVSSGAYMVLVRTESGERSTVRINTSLGYERVPLNDSTFVSAQLLSVKDAPDTNLYFTDFNGNLVHSIKRNDKFLDYNSSSSEYTFAPPYEDYRLWADYRGDAIFQDIFNDTLYRVRNHREITPHLVFHRGALSPRPEDKQQQDKKKKQVYFCGFMESGDYVFLNYYYDDKMWRDVWSKRDGSLMLHTLPKDETLFDIFLPFALPEGTVIDLQVVYADRDHVYCIMEALDACKFLPDVKEDDNPVILIAKLKNEPVET